VPAGTALVTPVVEEGDTRGNYLFHLRGCGEGHGDGVEQLVCVCRCVCVCVCVGVCVLRCRPGVSIGLLSPPLYTQVRQGRSHIENRGSKK